MEPPTAPQVTTYHIIPAHTRALWVLLGVLLTILVLGGTVLFKSALGARTSRFVLTGDGLRLMGDLYGRFIRATDLRGGASRIVDLRREHELAPAQRTLGTALPGYRSGWFRLRNGEKALLYVTDQRRVVYVPTRLGYSVLLSVTEPDSLLAALRTVAPGS